MGRRGHWTGRQRVVSGSFLGRLGWSRSISNQGAQHARAPDVPEVDAEEEQPHLLHHVLLVALLLLRLGARGLLLPLPRVYREQDEGQDLRRGEGAAEGDDAGRLRDPIEVVTDADGGGEEEEHDRDVQSG